MSVRDCTRTSFARNRRYFAGSMHTRAKYNTVNAFGDRGSMNLLAHLLFVYVKENSNQEVRSLPTLQIEPSGQKSGQALEDII